MTVSLTVVVALFIAYVLCLVLTNLIWCQRVQKLERYLVGQDLIIESLRAANDELHDAVFQIAHGEDEYPVRGSRVH